MAPIAVDHSPSIHRNGTPAAPSSHGALPAAAIDPTAARRPVEPITVESANLTYTEDALLAKYKYHSTTVKRDGAKFLVTPVENNLEFKTMRKVAKTGYVHLTFDLATSADGDRWDG
jgi:myo-inositol-1-phosphate synthase